MSKFWGGQGDSSDDDDTKLSDLDDGKVVGVGSKYLEKDDEKSTKSSDAYVLGLPLVSRVARKKCLKKMSTTVGQMEKDIEIKDWVNLPANFDKLNKQVKKVMKVAETKQVPTKYVQALVMLEDFSTAAFASKEPKRRRNNNALISLMQKLKNNNNQYEEMITTFRECPELINQEFMENPSEVPS